MTARRGVWIDCNTPQQGIVLHQYIPEWAELAPEELHAVREEWRQYQHCLFAATRFRAE